MVGYLLSIIFTLFLSAQGQTVEPGFYLTGNGAASRCHTVDCMCRVQPGPKVENFTTIYEAKRRYSVYFPNAEYEMTPIQTSAMQDYLGRLKDVSPRSTASVIAYTDACGSYDYNVKLANNRLGVARNYASSFFSVNHTLIHPEASTQCPLPEARRVDVIVHTDSRITRLIDKIPADVYLIDASGSMWEGWRNWVDVINASYKPGARIYVSMTRGCRYNQVINTVQPTGGTEIWYSYWKVLDLMQPGETLAIISDFQSDFPLRNWERQAIANKVSARAVRVIVIKL